MTGSASLWYAQEVQAIAAATRALLPNARVPAYRSSPHDPDPGEPTLRRWEHGVTVQVTAGLDREELRRQLVLGTLLAQDHPQAPLLYARLRAAVDAARPIPSSAPTG